MYPYAYLPWQAQIYQQPGLPYPPPYPYPYPNPYFYPWRPWLFTPSFSPNIEHYQPSPFRRIWDSPESPQSPWVQAYHENEEND